MTQETRSPNGEEPTTRSFVIWSFVIPSGFVIRISSLLHHSSFHPVLIRVNSRDSRAILEESRAIFRFCCQRGIDRGADALRVFVLRVHRLVIDEQRRGDLYSKGIAARMVGIDSLFDFFAVHVLSELIKIKPDGSRVG